MDILNLRIATTLQPHHRPSDIWILETKMDFDLSIEVTVVKDAQSNVSHDYMIKNVNDYHDKPSILNASITLTILS
jgi:hypothetical protein